MFILRILQSIVIFIEYGTIAGFIFSAFYFRTVEEFNVFKLAGFILLSIVLTFIFHSIAFYIPYIRMIVPAIISTFPAIIFYRIALSPVSAMLVTHGIPNWGTIIINIIIFIILYYICLCFTFNLYSVGMLDLKSEEWIPEIFIWYL